MEAQPQLQTVALGGRVLAIVPLDDYDALRDALEDAADAEAMRRALAEPEEIIPSPPASTGCAPSSDTSSEPSPGWSGPPGAGASTSPSPTFGSTGSARPPFNWSEPPRPANPIPPQQARTDQGGSPLGQKAKKRPVRQPPAHFAAARERQNVVPEPRQPPAATQIAAIKGAKHQPLNPY